MNLLFFILGTSFAGGVWGQEVPTTTCTIALAGEPVREWVVTGSWSSEARNHQTRFGLPIWQNGGTGFLLPLHLGPVAYVLRGEVTAWKLRLRSDSCTVESVQLQPVVVRAAQQGLPMHDLALQTCTGLVWTDEQGASTVLVDPAEAPCTVTTARSVASVSLTASDSARESVVFRYRVEDTTLQSLARHLERYRSRGTRSPGVGRPHPSRPTEERFEQRRPGGQVESRCRAGERRFDGLQCVYGPL